MNFGNRTKQGRRLLMEFGGDTARRAEVRRERAARA